MSGADDGAIVAWAASQSRLLITHDRNTLVGIAAERIRADQPVAGIVVLQLEQLSAGAAADEIILLADASLPGEWENRFVFLPLR